MSHRWRLLLTTTITTALLAHGLLGAPASASSHAPVYHLPAPAGTSLVVSRGNEHPTGRSRLERYAFDFVAPEGEPERFTVTAARGGTVIGQRSGVPGGRCTAPADGPRPRCWRNVNYVLIDHGDGSSGLYLHLRRGEPIVRTGQVVSSGQPIGTAGSSGWTDEVGVGFQVQATPPWTERGSGGWFLGRSQPAAFADPSVLEQRADGLLQEGDLVVSANPDPIREPFRPLARPAGLPALVPLEIDAERVVARAYDPDAIDGYGLHFAPAVERSETAPGSSAEGSSPDPLSSPSPDPLATLSPSAPDSLGAPLTDPGTMVRPIFGGELAYAGCGSGASASLGRMVVISRTVGDDEYLAVLGNLSEIEPTLLAQDPAIPLAIGPNELLGTYGVMLGPDEFAEFVCPEADPEADELFAAILRGATVSPEGEISGGTPVSPEPLVGRGAYEGLAWWSGPLVAGPAAEGPGRPRANWNRRTTAQAAHVPFGETVDLVARVRDSADIREVRFRAAYPRWPQPAESRDLPGFDPERTWRQLAVCRPPGASGEPRRTRGCTWEGDARDAIVSYAWDPTAEEPSDGASWLPPARTPMSRAVERCMPVSLAVEVVDEAGHVSSRMSRLPVPSRCDQRATERNEAARLVYLDPLVPPRTPVVRSETEDDRAFPYDPDLFGPDPFEGRVVWRDRADNEDGYNVYVRRNWLLPDCSTRFGRYVLVDTLPEDTTRYRPRHQRNLRRAPAPEVEGVPGFMTRYEVYLTAFNEAGETDRVYAGGFIAGGEANCDPGLELPPDDL